MASERILITATQDGILSFLVQSDGQVQKLDSVLKGIALEAVCQGSSGTFYAGADDGRIFESEEGEKWNQVSDGFPSARGLWTLAAHPVRPNEIYAGLEPVSVWISWDGGRKWEELPALRNHPASKQWRFYDPTKPHIRAIAFNRDGTRLHVGIEEGGTLISGDGGNSFEDRTAGVDPDVHTIELSHADPDLVFAMTGDGIFRSRNAGQHWERMDNGLDRSYVVPLALLHSDAKVLCVGAAGNTPGKWGSEGADSAIYRSEDWGGSWKMSEGPFPVKGMVASMVIDPGNRERIWACCSSLPMKGSPGKRWPRSFPELKK